MYQQTSFLLSFVMSTFVQTMIPGIFSSHKYQLGLGHKIAFCIWSYGLIAGCPPLIRAWSYSRGILGIQHLMQYNYGIGPLKIHLFIPYFKT